MRSSRLTLGSMLAMAAAMAVPAQAPAGRVAPPATPFRWGAVSRGTYMPTNKGGRRPATIPARPRRTRAQKLRTQARHARQAGHITVPVASLIGALLALVFLAFLAGARGWGNEFLPEPELTAKCVFGHTYVVDAHGSAAQVISSRGTGIPCT